MKHFGHWEFDSPDEPGSGKRMDHEFLRMLDAARDRMDLKFRINSGYRTETHNRKVGGTSNSSHLRGYAADISILGWEEADVVRLISQLVQVGFRRIGRARTFVHVDNDPAKLESYWDYFDGIEHKA